MFAHGSSFQVSQKSLSRRQNPYSGSKDSISYTLLDATKQPAFLTAFDNSGFKSFDKLLIAYKSRKGKFAAYTSEITVEEVERFISSVLNGDIQFTKIKQKPKLRWWQMWSVNFMYVTEFLLHPVDYSPNYNEDIDMGIDQRCP